MAHSTYGSASSAVGSSHDRRAPSPRSAGAALAASLAAGALLVSLASSAHAAGVPIEQATAEQKQSAQTSFQTGLKLFEAKQFGPAFKEFTGSYDVVKSPNAHFMMARCLTEMGELARAFNELLIVEDEARASPKYKTTLAESSQLRQELARKVSVIVITLKGSEQATITADGAPIPLRKQHAVSPGEVEIVATVHGEARKRERVNLLPGDVRPITIDIGAATSDSGGGSDDPPPGDDTVPPSTSSPDDGGGGGTGWFVAGGILGAAAVGLGIGTLVVGLDFLDDKAGSDEAATYNAEHAGDPVDCTAPQGKRATPFDCAALDKRDLSYGLGVATAVTGALGVTFLVVGAVSSGGSSSSEASLRIRVSPGAVGVGGTF